MTLQNIWFFLWGLLWAVYFMTDGFDLGIGSLLPFVGKTEVQKRTMLNAMGPLWDGNEVWLIAAGGITFAAFPEVYAVMFSSLYSALMLILFALIIRGVSFEFRSKVDHARWRMVWDICMFLGSLMPAVLFGVAFANIFQGIPFDNEGVYHGSLFTLLNPYGILGGLLFLNLFLLHGALWLAVKTEGELYQRSIQLAKGLFPLLVAILAVFLAVTWFSTDLYQNYLAHPGLLFIFLITAAALTGIRIYIQKGAAFYAWISSAAGIMSILFFSLIGLYPDLFPSSLDPAYSLTVYNAASSPLTLKIMLTVVILVLPVVIAYQIWTYHLFRGKVSESELNYEDAY